jgi:SAM-dependent methyltransferase
MPDILGEILKDAVSGLPAEHKTERDDGYITVRKGIRYVAPFKDWFEAEKLAIDYVRGRVLDIGCGAGRVSLYLKEQGLDVVGIDISPGAVEVAKSRGMENVHLMNAETLEFSEDTFDTVLLLGNNFGILGEVQRIVAMLRSLSMITTRDAVILAASFDPIVTDDPEHLAYHEINRNQGKPPGLVRLRFNYKGRVGDWWDQLLAERSLMTDIADQAGWRVDEFLSGPPQYYVGVIRKR